MLKCKIFNSPTEKEVEKFFAETKGVIRKILQSNSPVYAADNEKIRHIGANLVITVIYEDFPNSMTPGMKFPASKEK